MMGAIIRDKKSRKQIFDRHDKSFFVGNSISFHSEATGSDFKNTASFLTCTNTWLENITGENKKNINKEDTAKN